MKYLVDANVLSEPTKSQADQGVLDWLAANDADLFVNPIILGELEYGILLLPKSKKRSQLQQWFDIGRRQLNSVPIDATTATHWAKLVAALRRKGKSMPIKDSLIAATALQYQLIVATRNVRDFEQANVKRINPFSSSPV